MPQVDFYILPSSEPRDRLEYACKLTAKAWREGMQVYLRCIDAAQCVELDQRLWRFRGESFIPHDLIEDAPDSPVILGTAEPPQNREGLLINLAAGVPALVEGFTRVAELVIEDAGIRQTARDNFRFYRERGYPLRDHRLTRC